MIIYQKLKYFNVHFYPSCEYLNIVLKSYVEVRFVPKDMLISCKTRRRRELSPHRFLKGTLATFLSPFLLENSSRAFGRCRRCRLEARIGIISPYSR